MGDNAQDRLHPSHVTRSSDAGSFDEICINCLNTDRTDTWGRLALPCTNEPNEHRIARLLEAGQGFVDSVRGDR